VRQRAVSPLHNCEQQQHKSHFGPSQGGPSAVLLVCHDVLSERRPLTRPLSVTRTIRRINMENRWADDHKGKSKHLNEKLCLCHHQSPIDWPWNEFELTRSWLDTAADSSNTGVVLFCSAVAGKSCLADRQICLALFMSQQESRSAVCSSSLCRTPLGTAQLEWNGTCYGITESLTDLQSSGAVRPGSRRTVTCLTAFAGLPGADTNLAVAAGTASCLVAVAAVFWSGASTGSVQAHGRPASQSATAVAIHVLLMRNKPLHASDITLQLTDKLDYWTNSLQSSHIDFLPYLVFQLLHRINKWTIEDFQKNTVLESTLYKQQTTETCPVKVHPGHKISWRILKLSTVPNMGPSKTSLQQMVSTF
jgi:hypothetical protein